MTDTQITLISTFSLKIAPFLFLFSIMILWIINRVGWKWDSAESLLFSLAIPTLCNTIFLIAIFMLGRSPAVALVNVGDLYIRRPTLLLLTVIGIAASFVFASRGPRSKKSTPIVAFAIVATVVTLHVKLYFDLHDPSFY